MKNSRQSISMTNEGDKNGTYEEKK